MHSSVTPNKITSTRFLWYINWWHCKYLQCKHRFIWTGVWFAIKLKWSKNKSQVSTYFKWPPRWGCIKCILNNSYVNSIGNILLLTSLYLNYWHLENLFNHTCTADRGPHFLVCRKWIGNDFPQTSSIVAG